jgi:hypothetical protein
MKRPWTVDVVATLETREQRLVRLALKPVLDVAPNPGKCIFCDEETTWWINQRYVCPRDTAKYGFCKEEYLPDPCEVCGGQGEWTAGDRCEHSLCFRHRDDWMRWSRQPGLFPGHDKMTPAEWNTAWEKAWARFIKEAKERG